MRRLALIVLCVLGFPVFASHIVGGEFELIHISGNLYQLNLIIYFDKINGAPGAKDQGANAPVASIFRKRDGALMTNVTLPLIEEKPVEYTQPECSNDGLKTDRLFYSATIVLSPDTYDDPDGYYVSWQRCCRNYSITNIFSKPPSQNVALDPEAAGQTFYLEFPPVVKNREPFYNSSPRLFRPLSDYGCPNRPYYVDFTGVDDDNDSLVYSLATPFNTQLTTALPPAGPAPYPPVTWQPGFSPTNIMRGAPDLKISKDGLLTVTPTLQGLFVFAVKVEEFRNKTKIGETRRDFQMLVTDGCPHADPPAIVGRKLSETSFPYDNTMNVTFNASVPNEERCIVVKVTDPDSKKLEDGLTEVVRLRIVPLNFKSTEIASIVASPSKAVLFDGNSAEFTICFPQCPFFEGGPYQIGIIAMDDACSLPLLDTLKVNVTVQQPPNERVKFTTPIANTITDELNEGQQKSWAFEATDADKDELFFYAMPNGFDTNTAGMKTVIESNSNGIIKGRLEWNAFCDIYDFTNRTDFQLKLVVDDNDVCKVNEPDTVTFNLRVKLPGNANPIVDTDLTPDPQEVAVEGLEKKVNTDLVFQVTAKDIVDNDFLSLRLVGKDFTPSKYGMTFAKKTGNGSLQSEFRWDLRCGKEDLTTKEIYQLQFLAVDSTNKCRLLKADTVNVFVKVLPPDNSAPTLTVASLNERVPFTNNQLVAYLGDGINLELAGWDQDDFPEKDQLTIDLISATGDYSPRGYTFSKVTGTSGVKTVFSWVPDCSVFVNEDYENDYAFTFRVTDSRCGITLKDEVKVDLKLKDYESGVLTGSPPNVFTPNDDTFNDWFAMEKREPDGTLVGIIPPDNCRGSFLMVQVFNRWGKLVFESTDRNFRWLGKNEPAGVYYYYLKFSNNVYKGSVSLQY